MPVFVVHAQDAGDDEPVAALVRQLYAGQEAHGTRCASAQDTYEGDTEVRRAAAMVRALSDPKKWGGRKALYRRYAPEARPRTGPQVGLPAVPRP